MEAWELEQIRRSVAMLPEGHSAGALTKQAAVALFDEISRMKRDNERYRDAVARLKGIIAALEGREIP